MDADRFFFIVGKIVVTEDVDQQIPNGKTFEYEWCKD